MSLKSGVTGAALCGAVVLASVLAGETRAGTVEMKYVSSIYGATATATIVSGAAAGVYNLTAPGLLVFQQTGSPENPDYAPLFKTYCTEINQFADFSSFVYTEDTNISGTFGSADATSIAKLWQKNDAGNLTGLDASAFQIALYNLIYDTDLTVGSGNFSITSSTASLITTADAMLAWLVSPEAASYLSADLTLLVNASKQDQIIGVPVTGDIPEPATFGVCAIGMAGLLLRRKK